jgi:hypothetical protein
MKALRPKTFSAAAALAIALSLGAGQASAAVIAAGDFDTLDLGVQVRPDLPSQFRTTSNAHIGDMVGSVFFNSEEGVYTYVLEVTPRINNISEFNTGFNVLGFTGEAGYSFSQASAAGSTFTVHSDPDGTLDWEWNNGGGSWNSGEQITFFFRSTVAPDAIDVYSLINHRVGDTENYAPVPAPAALPAGLVLLGALAAARRRGRGA